MNVHNDGRILRRPAVLSRGWYDYQQVRQLFVSRAWLYLCPAEPRMVSPQWSCPMQCCLKLFIFMFPAAQHSSSKPLLALSWGISRRVLFEPYRGASPASLLFRTLLWGSSPSRVFTEDFNFRLSSRAVFLSTSMGAFLWRFSIRWIDIPVIRHSLR